MKKCGRGGRIASRFTACTGGVDTLTAVCPHDRDYAGLLGAHLHRLHEIMDAPPAMPQ